MSMHVRALKIQDIVNEEDERTTGLEPRFTGGGGADTTKEEVQGRSSHPRF